MSKSDSSGPRSIGLLGATGVGVGAIVGGGVLALAGVAFAATGPGAIAAFALNGCIALVTALSFAEMASAFPESGGTYTYAKKVLSVRAAFLVGWVVWFASIVAGVLYAVGFASYAVILLRHFWEAVIGVPPSLLAGRLPVVGLALGATAFYTLSLVRRGPGGGQAANLGKVIAFGVLIAGGLWALSKHSPGTIRGNLQPFLPAGSLGLVKAMGFTFIALQGFDLIAAGAGEIRNPVRNIPRAMLLSLAAALAIYIPLLFIVATVGASPGQPIAHMAAGNPEALVAVAAQNYLGAFGFWVVIAAALLSMLSALHANLFAASRVVLAMARDRTLPTRLAATDPGRGTPAIAILASAFTMSTVILVLRDVASAGAAASLIFLISFALTHWTSILARRRSGPRQQVGFRVPWFPLLPIVGGLSCAGLALFQGVAVPSAGALGAVWLGLGGLLFLVLFGRRARIYDASAEAQDPRLIQLRGRSPLVLVPVANPANAETMVAVANALAPPLVGRVLLLSVVTPPETSEAKEIALYLRDTKTLLGNALHASLTAGVYPETLATIASKPWSEIIRVSRAYRCESLLLGLSNLTEEATGRHLEELMSSVHCDVAVLRALPGWEFSKMKRILVPVAGGGMHDMLRARLLGNLMRTGSREVTLLRILPPSVPKESRERARRDLARLAEDEVPGRCTLELVENGDVAQEVAGRAADHDLVILGLQRHGRRRKVFGDVALAIARTTKCGIIMISRRG